MSTLTSLGKLASTVPDLVNRPRQLVFLTPIDSQLNDFLNEIHQIARWEPTIVECIDQDLDVHAKKKKLLRLVDEQFLAGQEELRRMSQLIDFLNGKARGEAKRKKLYFQLLRRVRRLRRRLLRDLESVRRNLEGRADLPPSRRLMAQEALCLIAEDLAAVEQTANVCERRIMKQEKVPVAEKIISLSDSDASFIVKGGWNTLMGYRPQLARSGRGFVTALVLPSGLVSWLCRNFPKEADIFIRSHLRLADERSAFLDHKARCFHVPDQLGT